MKRMVLVTSEESSPGVPAWGPDQNATEVPTGSDEVAIENLVAGRLYYVKTWNEDEFGNRSNELVRHVQTGAPGRTTLLPFGANGSFDEGSGLYAFVHIPYSVLSVTEAVVRLAFREFTANAQEAASSGALTSATDGGTTTPSGGGSTSGASSASSSNDENAHVHLVFTYNDDTPPVSTKREYAKFGGGTVNIESSTNGNIQTAQGNNHSHGIAHTHTTPSHDHSVPNHSHSVPSHDHALVYGTFEETYPATHSVFMNVYKRVATEWVIQGFFGYFTDDWETVDVSSVINGPGDYRIAIASEAGQPNDGRMGCDIYGTLTVVLAPE